MRSNFPAGAALLGLLLGLSFGCTGSGSDVGPSAPGRADSFARGLVEDRQGRPIVSARFRLLPGGPEAVVGSSGRFLLPGPVPGAWLCELDGRFGSSAAGTRFGRLRLMLSIPPGAADLSRALVLPDLAEGALTTVTPGVQPGPLSLECPTGSISLAGGSTVLLDSDAGPGALGLGALSESDLPLPLELGAGELLATRALVVDPPLARFEPGGGLRIANTLGLAASQPARLHRLNPETGAWEAGLEGTVSGDGLWVEAPAGSVLGGGVYLFAVSRPPAASTLVGGIVRTPLGWPVGGVLVRGPEGRSAVSGPDGSFALGPLAATLASGAGRQVELVLRAGGGWAPGRLATTAQLLSGVETPLGELTLETAPTASCQVVGALRGRGLPWRQVRGGAGDMVLRGRLDGSSLLEWEDVPLGRCMARTAWQEHGDWFSGLAQRFHGDQDRLFSMLLVTADGNPRTSYVRRGIAARAVAGGGGGPLAGVELFIGRDAAVGRRGLTDEFGLLWISGLRGPQVLTGYRLSSLGGRTLKAVVTLDGVDSDSLDLPLPILLRSPGSDFVPFGEVQGTLSGGTGGTLAVTGRSYLDSWEVEEALLGGDALDGTAPLKDAPPEFCAGVPAGRGTLLGTERVAGRLARMGVRTEVALAAGTRTSMDLALDLPALAAVRLAGILGGLDSRIDPAQLTCGFGLRLASGEGLLVAQGLAPSFSGADLALQVPALEGALAGAERMVAVEGQASAGGLVLTQRALAKGSGEGLAASFLAVPTLVRPTPGSFTDPAALVVEWGGVPAGTTALRLQVRWTAGAEEGLWDAWVHPDAAAFAFFPLPEGAFAFWPASGTELRYTLTCYRFEGTFLAAEYPFHRLMGALAYAEPERLGVTALARIAFSTTVP